jgi:hypothetical protein
MGGPAACVEAHAPSREIIRDARGQILGTIECQPLTGWRVARVQGGKIVGICDPRRNVTRTQDGKVIAQGDVLGGLLLASGRRQ